MEDTICAISTAISKSGIGIVRLSGREAFELGKKHFKSKTNSNIENRKLMYGNFYDNNENLIDEVLISFIRGPKSYTTEDMVEVYSHGSIVSVKKILESFLHSGARMAERGEFTKRAFLNGRIDLTKAEAVLDLINSETEIEHRSALNQLEGSVTREIDKILDDLTDLNVLMEASINFSEDDEIEPDKSSLIKKTEEVLDEIEILIESHKRGKIIKNGIKTIIIGKPNVGKSSLLNNFLNENRAIVTDIPGTTRDVIEEFLDVDGLSVKIVDTAGIRLTEDLVEKIGVEKSLDLSKNADLIIAIFDGSKELEKEDYMILDHIRDKEKIIVVNKTDLDLKINLEEIEKRTGSKPIFASMNERKGIKEILDSISSLFFSGKIEEMDDLVITSSRQENLLKKAYFSLKNVLKGLEDNIFLDLIDVDLKIATDSIAEILGRNFEKEDVLDQIFKKFCIGK